MAAVLPCQLGYAEIGTALAAEGRGGANRKYAEWIRTYSWPEFIAGAEELGSLLDDLTAQWPAREMAHLETLFLTSSRSSICFGKWPGPKPPGPCETDSGRRSYADWSTLQGIVIAALGRRKDAGRKYKGKSAVIQRPFARVPRRKNYLAMQGSARIFA